MPDSDITGNVVRSFHVDMTQPWHTNHPFICGGLGCYQGHPSASLEGRCSNGPSRVVRRSVGANSQKKAKVEAEERPCGWVVWTYRFLLVGLGWLLWCQRLLFSLLREWDVQSLKMRLPQCKLLDAPTELRLATCLSHYGFTARTAWTAQQALDNFIGKSQRLLRSRRATLVLGFEIGVANLIAQWSDVMEPAKPSGLFNLLGLRMAQMRDTEDNLPNF